MTNEECKTLLESQNWYKLFYKRITEFESPLRLEYIIKSRFKGNIIINAFSWRRTTEGSDYWCKISHEWRNLARGAS